MQPTQFTHQEKEEMKQRVGKSREIRGGEDTSAATGKPAVTVDGEKQVIVG